MSPSCDLNAVALDSLGARQSVETVQRNLYRDVWSSLDRYGEYSPGERYLPLFLDMTQTTMRTSVLDAGCGSGKGALALQAAGFTDVQLCDLVDDGLAPNARTLPFTPTCLWSDLKRQIGFVDWVYCCDVLEHIPTPFAMLVVSRLLEVARRGVFLSISVTPDQFGVWVGEPLHHTVQSFVSWRDQLASVGRLVEARDLLHTGIYFLRGNRAQ